MTTATPALDTLSVNTIRALSIDTVLKANSGHPGLPLGAAPVGYSLFARTMRHSPKNPDWPDRDRFVLSAGHGSALLYSLLHLTGYDLALDQLKQFRQLGSQTPGHPEHGDTAGVETTTGPLGQGFGNAVGMALAERHLAARFNRPGHEIVDHRTFVLCGDGDLMEGVANEAASLAGHLGFGKLVCFYDSNHICLAASTNLVFTTDVAKVFEGYGWHVQTVGDGNDLAAIAAATETALAVADRPSLVIVRTEIGYASPKQGTFGVHGSPLDAAQVVETKKKLGYPSEEPFFIPEDALRHLRSAVERGQAAEASWRKRFEAYRGAHPDLAAEFERVMAGELPKGWDADIPTFTTAEKPLATRSAGGKVINAIAARVPELVGGSADLNPSTDTALKGAGDFQSPARQVSDRQGAVGGEWGYAGRNLHFGVREHAMAAISSGIALHGGLIPFSATFFTFADYMRPSIRLASIMKLHSIFVFTHDSIGVGEDGPTHQPVEQAASLRAIPRLVVIRPGDANETASAWRVAMTRRGPVALLLTRQALPVLAGTDDVAYGGYVLADSDGPPDVILIATGSELHVAVDARLLLAGRGVKARVVSLPSWELFEAQPQAYRDSVLPPTVLARVAVEAGVPQGWDRYVGPFGAVVGVEGRFGASAPVKVVMEAYGFTPGNVAEKALAVKDAVAARLGSMGLKRASRVKALVLTAYRKLEVMDVPRPEPGPRDVRVRVRACGICGSDVHGYDGGSGRRIPPLIMGHEAAGVVDAVGAEVAAFKPGDRVSFDSTIHCGECAFCRAGQVNLCDRRRVVGVSPGEYRQDGGFAEAVVVPERIVCRVPDPVSFEHAAMVEPLSVAVHAARRAKITAGDRALVVGCGMIGLLTLQAAKAAGCASVIAVDLDEGRLAQAARLGADVTLGPRDDVSARVASLTGGRGVDVAFEAVGAAEPIATAVRGLRKGGTLVLIGNVTPKVEVDLQAIVTRELSLVGTCASNGEYPASLELLARGAVRLDGLISQVAPLEEGPAWFERLYAREPGLMKVILQP